MNPLSIIFPVICFAFYLVIALFVLFNKPRTMLTWLFLAQIVCNEVWLFGTIKMFQNIASYDSVIFWDRFVYIGAIVYVPLLFHFTVTYIKQWKRYSAVVVLMYFIAAVFLILSRFQFFVDGVFVYQWGVHTYAHIAHHFYLVCFSIVAIGSWYLLYKYFKQQTDPLEQERTKYLLLALIAMVTLDSTGFLPAYGIGIIPIPFVSGLVVTSLIAYAITRYQLMSLVFVVQRSAIYLTATFIIGAVFTGLIFWAYYFGVDVNIMLAILVLCIILLLLQPIQKLIERFFLKPEYDFSKKLRKFPLRKYTCIQQAFTMLAENLLHEGKITNVLVYTVDPGSLAKDKFGQQYPKNNPDDNWPVDKSAYHFLQFTQTAVHISELKAFPSLVNVMKAKHAQFILPFSLMHDLGGCIFITISKETDVAAVGEELKKEYATLATAVATGLRLDYYYTPAEE